MNFTHEKIEHQDVKIDHLIALPDGPVTNATTFLMPLHQVSVVSAPDPIMLRIARGITGSGGRLVFFDGSWSDNNLTAEAIRSGRDAFGEMVGRIHAAVEIHATPKGKVLVFGTSKYGFSSLLAMSENPRIDALVAFQPGTYRPALREFQGMAGNFLMRRYDLAARIDRFGGRDIFFEINQADHRVREDLSIELAEQIKTIYKQQGCENNLVISIAESLGHCTTEENIDHALDWLKSKKYL